MSTRPSEPQLAAWNRELRSRSPLEVTRWAVAHAPGRAIVSTNFRPYEAVLLHLATLAQPDIPVLWVDHGYNRPATYRHAEALRSRLGLRIAAYLPRLTAAHRDALHGPVPDPADETAMKAFSAQMKLEPFQRGMRELAPRVWLTALRRDQTATRAGLDLVSWDENFGTLKVSPLLYWDDAQLDLYLREHDLPNEFDYHDPAKGDAKRECGLHAAWGRKALAAVNPGGAAR
jgi:phosphoadenosine phosphosulfate reductase